MTIRRLPIVALGLCLAVLAAPHVPRAQAQLPFPTTPTFPEITMGPHHVTGTVELGNCGPGIKGAGLNGAVLKLVEYWYVGSSTTSNLVVPAHGATLDNLAPMAEPNIHDLFPAPGAPLVQGRVVSSVNLTGAGAFDLTWSDIITPPNPPSRRVLNQATGKTMTAYRMLKLEVTTGGNTVGSIKTPPVILFSGTETAKDVGVVTVNCGILG
ncbi:MAG: hypothetical protein ACRENN_03710 [Candidatus Eiseniibacteriota bacterium]